MKKRILAILLLVVMLMLPCSGLAHIDSIRKPTPTPAPKSLYMEINSDSRMQWEKVSNNRLKLRIKVTNSSYATDIEAFEIYVKALNVWGEYIYGDDTVYYATTEKDVEPGETVWSTWITIPNRDEIHEIECGIKREVDEYGDVTVLNDWEIDYWTWDYD